MKRICRLLVLLAGLSAVSVANAIPISFSFEGSVDFADADNAYGLSVGDSIFGTAFVPDALGTGSEFFTPGDGLSLFFQVGTVGFSTEEDFDFPNFPILSLIDGEVSFLDFFAFDFDFLADFNTAFIYPNWTGLDGEGLSTGGALTATRVSVPEPGTLALLAIGLLGMGLTRRRKPA